MLKVLKQAPSVVYKLTPKIKFPEKLKGTLIEKWANYWKNLFIDYRQMLQDLRTDMQDEPKKALLWSGGIAAIYSLARNNPTERDFNDNLRKINNELIMLSDDVRNPNAIEHLRYLQTCSNEGVMQYKNLGIISFMYITELSNSCDLYRARCTYLQPSIFSFFSRVADVGFMGRWWNIHIKTTNYDVNM